MSGFLISCCNTGPQLSRFGLVYFEPESGRLAHLALDADLPFAEITGFTGIASDVRYSYVAVQSKQGSALLILDRQKGSQRFLFLNEYLDLHSMEIIDGELRVAATSTNQQIVIDPNRGTYEVRREWPAPRSLHINVISERGNQCLVLMHRQVSTPDEQTHDGVLFDAVSGTVKLGGLKHPHNITWDIDGACVVLDSATGRVFRSGASGFVVAESFPGCYVRGYCDTEEWRIVCVSGRRIFSRKSGTAKKYYRGTLNEFLLDRGFEAALELLDKRSGERRAIPFDHYGTEIYDIMPFDPEHLPLLEDGGVRRAKLIRWLFEQAHSP